MDKNTTSDIEQASAELQTWHELIDHTKAGGFYYLAGYFGAIFIDPRLQVEILAASFFGFAFVAFASIRYFLSKVALSDKKQKWIKSYILCFLAVPCTWATFTIWVVSHSSELTSSTAIVLVTGSSYAAGSVSSTNTSLSLSRVTLACLFIPVALALIIYHNNQTAYLLCFLMFVFSFFLEALTKKHHDAYWKAFWTTVELKKHSHLLELARNEAIEANESKTQFLAHMSHEIRTPLNGVIGSAELLSCTNLNPQQEQHLGLILSSSRILKSLINDILDISKINSKALELKPSVFNLENNIMELMAVFKPLAENKNIELNLLFSEKLKGQYNGDQLRIEQILLNLLSNALKFTDKGSVTLKVEAPLLLDLENPKVRFSVIDTGIGIKEKYIKTLFKQFVQVENYNPNIRGTGLGLSICKKLVELMDGHIGVTSEEQKGSTFWFEIPLKDVPQDLNEEVINSSRSIQEDQSGSKNEVSDNKLTVLVAEDNDINQTLMAALLKRFNYKSIIANNGRDAIKLFVEHKPDIILMDCNMPVMGGIEATREIRLLEERNKLSRTPIIAITAHAFSEIVEELFESGMDDHVAKPLSMKQLEEKLSKWSKEVE